MVVTKVVGAGAELGMNLKDLKMLGDRVNRATRSMGVALTSCTVPAQAGPPLPSAMMKWKWASAFMARRAGSA